MATITADHIASVSLKDADRNPDEFAQKLGRSFEEYGFAIIADHGIPDDLIHRAEEKAKAFFALPGGGEAEISSSRAAAARAATRRSGSRPPRAPKRTTSRNSGTSAATCPKATSSARTCRTMSGRPKSQASKDTFNELYATFDSTGLKVLRAIARYLKIDEDYFADTVRDGNSVLRAAPLSAAERADRQPHPRRRA